MKAHTIIALALITLTCSMCGQTGQKGKNDNATPPVKKDTATAASKDSMGKSCMKTMDSVDWTKHVSKQLEVKGEVETPLVLTIDSLKKMDVVIIKNYNIVCPNGAQMKGDSTCKGVLLRDILGKAKIKQASHKDRNFYIVARATDDYLATFSWAEIFNNETGNNTYVIFEENGMPIKEKGDMILICKNDILTGVRHVYWLKSIEVYRVN